VKYAHLYTPTHHINMKMTMLHSSEFKNFIGMSNKSLKTKSPLIVTQPIHQTILARGFAHCSLTYRRTN